MTHAEHDYLYMLDPSGAETTSAMTLRDFARWGQFVLNRGRVVDRQVLPAHIFQGGDQAAFAHAGYETMPNWSFQAQRVRQSECAPVSYWQGSAGW